MQQQLLQQNRRAESMPPLTARLPTTPGNSAAHRPQVAGLSPTKRRHLSAHSGSLSSSDRAQLAGLNRTAAHSSEDGERQSASVPGTHSRPVLLFSPSSPLHPPIRTSLSPLSPLRSISFHTLYPHSITSITIQRCLDTNTTRLAPLRLLRFAIPSTVHHLDTFFITS